MRHVVPKPETTAAVVNRDPAVHRRSRCDRPPSAERHSSNGDNKKPEVSFYRALLLLVGGFSALLQNSLQNVHGAVRARLPCICGGSNVESSPTITPATARTQANAKTQSQPQEHTGTIPTRGIRAYGKYDRRRTANTAEFLSGGAE